MLIKNDPAIIMILLLTFFLIRLNRMLVIMKIMGLTP